jgi:hypothetical protein
MKPYVLSFALLSATAIVVSAPAQATGTLLTRTFVSSTGVDTNPCTVTQPCATFAAAYALTQTNGIIAALDPGKYGPLTGMSIITTGVTINGNGWAAITAPAQGYGITITAGTANVTLIGLEIDGAGAAYNGIVVNSAGNLTVTNCTLQNFVNGGGYNTILIQPSSGTINFTIANTTASNNDWVGVYYYPASGSPTARGVIDHVVADANTFGIGVNPQNASGGTAVLAVSNSIASDNTNTGIFVEGESSAPAKASLDNVSVSANGTGVAVAGVSTVFLGRSVITGNDTGVTNTTSPNTFYSMQNNVILGNSSRDGYSSLSTGDTLH